MTITAPHWLNVHPSNKALRPDEVEPSFDPVSKTRNIDWYWNRLIAQVSLQSEEATKYFDLKNHGAYYEERASKAYASARAARFLLIGDGTPWTDPTGKLTLWECAP